MLDQNLAIIIAAIIGGLLTIAGGLAANFYLHNRTIIIEKRKELRNILEEIYTCALQISIACNSILVDRSNLNQSVSQIYGFDTRIQTLLELYLNSLISERIEIRGAIAELVYVLSQYQNDVIDVGEFKKCLGDYNQSGEIFLNRIVHLAFDKGYSYLK
jgi:hypothetical protein